MPSLRPFWPFVLLVACSLCTVVLALSNGGTTITFGVSLTLSGPPNIRLEYGRHTRDGVLLWLSEANTHGVKVNNQTYSYNVTILDDAGNATLLVQNYKRLINDSEVDFLLGPVNTDFSMIVKPITEAAGRVIVGTSAGGTTFHKNSEWVFSAASSNLNFLKALVPEFRINNATTIVTVYENSPATIDMCTGWEQDLEDQGITVIKKFVVDSSLTGVTEAGIQNVTRAVGAASELNPDVLFVCMFTPFQNLTLKAMKDLDWVPKLYIGVPYTAPQWATTDPLLQNYMIGVSPFDPTAEWITDGRNFGNPVIYNRQFRARFGYDADAPAAFGTAAPLLLHLAITKTGKLDQVSIRNGLLSLNEETFMGRFQFSTDHGCQAPAIATQVFDGLPAIVAPPFAAVKNVIFPIPKWSERVYVENFPAASEIVVFILTCLSCVVAISFIVFVVIRRKHQVIMASAPTFLYAMLVGSLLLFSSNFVSLWTKVSDVQCHLQIWFLAVGFTIYFGALTVKTWRVWRLYSNRTVSIIQITDVQLLSALAGITGITIVLMVLVSSVASPTATHVIVDPYRPIYDYYVCRHANATPGLALVSIILGYNGLVIIGGLYLAYRVRKIPYFMYDESKIIGFSIYTTAFFSMLLTILELTQAAGREAMFVIRAIGILFCITVNICYMFYHKHRFITLGFTSASKKDSLRTLSNTKGSAASLNISKTNTSNGGAGSGAGGGTSGQLGSMKRSSSGTNWKGKFEKLQQDYNELDTRYKRLLMKDNGSSEEDEESETVDDTASAGDHVEADASN